MTFDKVKFRINHSKEPLCTKCNQAMIARDHNGELVHLVCRDYGDSPLPSVLMKVQQCNRFVSTSQSEDDYQHTKLAAILERNETTGEISWSRDYETFRIGGKNIKRSYKLRENEEWES